MAVYGAQLNFFAEQFRLVDYFFMQPRVASSHHKREDLGKVKGVFQYMKRGELKMEEEALADVNVPTFWTKQKLNVGYYYLQKGDEVYRIVNPSDWSHEGGFYCYVLESVVGNTDTQEAFEYVDLGQNSYD